MGAAHPGRRHSGRVTIQAGREAWCSLSRRLAVQRRRTHGRSRPSIDGLNKRRWPFKRDSWLLEDGLRAGAAGSTRLAASADRLGRTCVV